MAIFGTRDLRILLQFPDLIGHDLEVPQKDNLKLL
jgi:hypothetical protein